MNLENVINDALSSDDSNEPDVDIEIDIDIEQIEREMNIISNGMAIAEQMKESAYLFNDKAKIERQAREIVKKCYELTLFNIRQLHRSLPD